MTYFDVLPFCLFFKGEVLAPPSLDETDRCLWHAEMKICEELPFMIDEENPRTSLAEVVYSFLGKWYPYDFRSMMDRYLEKAPELRESLKFV